MINLTTQWNYRLLLMLVFFLTCFQARAQFPEDQFNQNDLTAAYNNNSKRVNFKVNLAKRIDGDLKIARAIHIYYKDEGERKLLTSLVNEVNFDDNRLNKINNQDIRYSNGENPTCSDDRKYGFTFQYSNFVNIPISTTYYTSVGTGTRTIQCEITNILGNPIVIDVKTAAAALPFTIPPGTTVNQEPITNTNDVRWFIRFNWTPPASILNTPEFQDPFIELEYDVKFDNGSSTILTTGLTKKIEFPRPDAPSLVQAQADTLCDDIPVRLYYDGDKDFGQYVKLQYKAIDADDSEYFTVDPRDLGLPTVFIGGKYHALSLFNTYTSVSSALRYNHNRIKYNLKRDKTYVFRAVTYNLLNRIGNTEVESFSSSIYSGLLVQEVKPPNGVRASTNLCGQIELGWSPGDLTPGPTYKIYRSLDKDHFPATPIATLVPQAEETITSYTDDDPALLSDTTYFYKISAAKGCNIEGDFSATVVGKTFQPVQPASEAPTARQADPAATAITLEWLRGINDSSAVVRKKYIDSKTVFEVWRQKVEVDVVNGKKVVRSEEPLELISGSAFKSTTFVDRSAQACQNYVYQVYAFNNCGDTKVPYLKTAPVSSLVNPDPITGFYGSKGTYPNRVRLSWDLQLNNAPFGIFRSADGTETQIAKVSAGAEDFYDDFTAEPGKLYTYTIRPLDCDDFPVNTPALAATTDGFYLAYGTAAGKVTFIDNTPVNGVRMKASYSGAASQDLFRSIALDGTQPVTITDHPQLNPDRMALAFFFKPQDETYSSDYTLIDKMNGAGGYEVKMEGGELIFSVRTGGSRVSVRHPASQLPTSQFNQIIANVTNHAIQLFVNGELVGKQAVDPASITKSTGMPLAIGTGFSGHLDELRLWNAPKDSLAVARDYQTLVDPSRENLVAYWRADEGFGNKIYDVADNDGVFHHSDSFSTPAVTFSTTVPTADRLGTFVYTNEVGEYELPYLPYTGIGSRYTIEPILDDHVFEYVNSTTDPKAATWSITVNSANNQYSALDFIDKSGFTFRAIVRYTDQCRASDINILLDGEQVFTASGDTLKTNSDGEAVFTVPQGEHTVSVFKEGHVFRESSFSDNFDVLKYGNGQGRKTFFNETRIVVRGRVNGGTVQANLPLTNQEELSNIGPVKLTFTDTKKCDSIVVNTNEYGVYAVELLPTTTYAVRIERGNAADPVTRFFAPDTQSSEGKATPEPITFNTVPKLTFEDTLSYNRRINYIYRAQPTVFISSDASSKTPFRGDRQIVLKTVNSAGEEQAQLIDLFDQNGNALLGDTRVIKTGNDYSVYLSVEEIYSDASGNVTDTVTVQDGEILVDNGLDIFADTTQIYSLSEDNNVIQLNFKGAQPNFSARAGNATSAEDFQKKLVVNYRGSANYAVSPNTIQAYVLGVSEVESPSFIPSVEQVDFILRDPPGSNSSATLSESTTTSKTITNVFGGGSDVNVDIGFGTTGKVGTFAGLGAGVTKDLLQFQAKATVSVGTSLSGSDAATTNISTTYGKDLSTSSSPELAGAPSDLFIGSSYVFRVGIAQKLKLVPASETPCDFCSGTFTLADNRQYRIKSDNILSVGVDSVKGFFAFTTWEIENKIIPPLEDLVDDLFIRYPGVYDKTETNPDGSPTWVDQGDYVFKWHRRNGIIIDEAIDSVNYYRNKIDNWKSILANNERKKVNARFAESISFGGGSEVTRSTAISNTDTDVSTFNLQLNGKFNKDFGASIVGAKFKVGLTIGANFNYTRIEDNTSVESRQISYNLADSDNGDFYNIEIARNFLDPSPVYKLRGGQSMCPWFGPLKTRYYNPGTVIHEGAAPREKPVINPQSAFVQNVSEHNAAFIEVELGNESPTNDIQWYGVRLIESSNPEGAVVQFNSAGASPNRTFEIPPGQSVVQQLTVKKPKGSPVYEYNDLQLQIYSTCEYSFFTNGGVLQNADTMNFSVHFDKSCADVNIVTPTDLWTINTNNFNSATQQDELPVLLQGTGLGTEELQKVQFQYRSKSSAEWIPQITFWNNLEGSGFSPEDVNLLADFVQSVDTLSTGAGTELQYQLPYTWVVSNLPDGEYEIRAKTFCNAGITYTTLPFSGVIDRQRPAPFGAPQPADGILSPGDEIQVRFNETIDQTTLTKDDFSLSGMLNGTPKLNPHNVSVAFSGADGSTAALPAGINLLNSPQFSIHFYVKKLRSGVAETIMQQGNGTNGWSVGFNASDQLVVTLNGVSYTGDAVFRASDPVNTTWYQVGITYEQGIAKPLRILVNKVLDKDFTVANALQGNADPIILGRGANQNFNGNLHDLSLFNERVDGKTEALSGAEKGLLAYWPLDEGNGTVLEDKVHSRNGKLNGEWEIERTGFAANFTGNSYLYFSGTNTNLVDYSPDTDFTIETWLNYPAAPAPGTKMTLIANGQPGTANGSAWALSINGNNELVLDHGSQTDRVLAEGLQPGEWQHVALVVNRFTQVSGYLNGQLQQSYSVENFSNFTGDIALGAQAYEDGDPNNGKPSNSEQFYTGALDEVRFWRYARTRQQIDENRFARLTGLEVGLSVFFPFEFYVTDIDGQLYEPTFSPLAQQRVNNNFDVVALEELDSANVTHVSSPVLKQPEPLSFVDFTFLVNDDEILLVPNVRPEVVERVVLDVAIKSVFDLNGNEIASPLVWSAFVKRNQLQWENSSTALEKEVGEPLTFQTTIYNTGGAQQAFTIDGLPAWLEASPSRGLMEPDSEQQITFTVKPGLNLGNYEANLSLDSELNFTDKFLVKLKVVIPPPSWAVNPADYEGSMSIVGSVFIGAARSSDPDDRVAAFVNDSLRGVTRLQYVPEYDQHFAFLDIYGRSEEDQKQDPFTEQVTFQVWDASEGRLYAQVLPDNIDYADKGNQGTPGNPVDLVTQDLVFQQIPIEEGWNWISMNVTPNLGNNPAALFGKLDAQNGDEIKMEDGNQLMLFRNGKWQGEFQTVNTGELYKVKLSRNDTLLVLGQPVNPSTVPIPLVDGWNRVGYVSDQLLSVGEALSSITPEEGDLIKGQKNFAVYDEGLKEWIGSLSFLQPGQGYMINLTSANSESLVYPSFSLLSTARQASRPTVPELFTEGSRYPHTMSIIAGADEELVHYLSDKQQVRVYHGDELRGIAQLQWFNNRPYFFITVHGDAPGEKLVFSLHDPSGEKMTDLGNTLTFGKDAVTGNRLSPYKLSRWGEAQAFSLHPNPMQEQLTIQYHLDREGDMQLDLVNLNGQTMGTLLKGKAPAGNHQFQWNGKLKDQRLPRGVYIVRFTSAHQTSSKKLIIK